MFIHSAILGKSIPFSGLLDFSNILLKTERFCDLSLWLEAESFGLIGFLFLFLLCFVLFLRISTCNILATIRLIVPWIIKCNPVAAIDSKIAIALNG